MLESETALLLAEIQALWPATNLHAASEPVVEAWTRALGTHTTHDEARRELHAHLGNFPPTANQIRAAVWSRKTLDDRLTIAVRISSELFEARLKAYPDHSTDECAEYALDSVAILTTLDAWQIEEHAQMLGAIEASKQATLTSGGAK